jgi:hypothetical protein
MLHHHHELEGISADSAAETVENLLVLVDVERGRLLGMEGTPCHVIPPALPESHVLGNKRYDVDGIPDFVKKSIRKQGHKVRRRRDWFSQTIMRVYENSFPFLKFRTTR